MHTCMCVCVHVHISISLSLCVLAKWWHLPSPSISPRPSLAAAPFSSFRRKEQPLSRPKKAAVALPGSCPARNFPKKQEEEGERTPTNQFYKLDAPTSPALEALLEREVGREEVTKAGQRNKGGDRSTEGLRTYPPWIRGSTLTG